jgi:hypothetical protein
MVEARLVEAAGVLDYETRRSLFERSPSRGCDHHVRDFNRAVANFEGRAVPHRKLGPQKANQQAAGEALVNHDLFGGEAGGEHL